MSQHGWTVVMLGTFFVAQLLFFIASFVKPNGKWDTFLVWGCYLISITAGVFVFPSKGVNSPETFSMIGPALQRLGIMAIIWIGFMVWQFKMRSAVRKGRSSGHH